MKLILEEEHVREILKKMIQEKFVQGTRVSPVPNSFQNSRASQAQSTGYTGNLVNIFNGKKYLGNNVTGIMPQGFWENFRKDLQQYLSQNYPGVSIYDNGVIRDLQSAAYPSNSARVSGSKHGVGMAQDIMITTPAVPKYVSLETNKQLATDQKLVSLFRSFMQKYPTMRWGGDFGGSSSSPSGRGITEFHHFEIKDDQMPQYFKSVETQLQQAGWQGGSASLNSTSQLSLLYKHLLK